MLKEKPKDLTQQNLFVSPANGVPHRKFISTFRVTLVKDRSVSFNRRSLSNSAQAHPLICKLIEEHGNSDREQFCILMLSAKNEIIGLNIVSTGALFSAQVAPREVLKAAILANLAALILAHNHPSSDVQPSPDDLAVTETKAPGAAANLTLILTAAAMVPVTRMATDAFPRNSTITFSNLPVKKG
jgi:DNA repair protein RadC